MCVLLEEERGKGKEKLSLNFALFKKKVVEGKGEKKRVRENNEAFH